MQRSEFAALIKQKYPAYTDIDDDELVDRALAKYPVYSQHVEPKQEKSLFDMADVRLGDNTFNPIKAFTETMAIPKNIIDAGARQSARMMGLPVDDKATVGSMIGSITSEEDPISAALGPAGMLASSLKKASEGSPRAHAAISTATEKLGDLAYDPMATGAVAFHAPALTAAFMGTAGLGGADAALQLKREVEKNGWTPKAASLAASLGVDIASVAGPMAMHRMGRGGATPEQPIGVRPDWQQGPWGVEGRESTPTTTGGQPEYLKLTEPPPIGLEKPEPKPIRLRPSDETIPLRPEGAFPPNIWSEEGEAIAQRLAPKIFGEEQPKYVQGAIESRMPTVASTPNEDLAALGRLGATQPPSIEDQFAQIKAQMSPEDLAMQAPPPDEGGMPGGGRAPLNVGKVSRVRALNIAKGFYDKIKDRAAAILGEEEARDLNVVPLRNPYLLGQYRGKRMLKEGAQRTGELKVAIEQIAADATSPADFADQLAETITHEIGHTHGIHQFPQSKYTLGPEGHVVADNPYFETEQGRLEVPEGMSETYREGLTPEEHRFQTANDILKHDPQVQELRAQLRDIMEANPEIWTNLRGGVPVEGHGEAPFPLEAGDMPRRPLEERQARLAAQAEGGERHPFFPLKEREKVGEMKEFRDVHGRLPSSQRELAGEVKIPKEEPLVLPEPQALKRGDLGGGEAGVFDPFNRGIKLTEPPPIGYFPEKGSKREAKAYPEENFVEKVLGVPRSVSTAFDVSGLRQGLIQSVSHPFLAADSFIKSLGAGFSQSKFDAVKDRILGSENADIYKKFGLAFSELEARHILERDIPINSWGRKIPGVKQSDRMFTAYLNLLRANVFDHQIDRLQSMGFDPRSSENAKTMKVLTDWINTTTGRGRLPYETGRLSRILGATLFSPRLLAARILTPVDYVRAVKDPKLRGMATKDMASFLAFGLTNVALAAAAGATVEWDPRSANFAKPRFGNTTMDFWGGYQQLLRVGVQTLMKPAAAYGLAKGNVKTQYGQVTSRSLQDIASQFVRQKLSPGVGLAVSALEGTDPVGKQFGLGTVADAFLPMSPRDMWEYVASKNRPDLISAATLWMALTPTGLVAPNTREPIEGLSGRGQEELLRMGAAPPFIAKSYRPGGRYAESEKLSPSQYEHLSGKFSKEVMPALDAFIQSKEYREMPDAQKKLALKRVTTRMSQISKRMALEEGFGPPERERP